MSAATPASWKLRTACSWRPRSMSIVVSRPPVFESAHAIQIPDRPVDVPISSARVYPPLITRSWSSWPSDSGTFMSCQSERCCSKNVVTRASSALDGAPPWPAAARSVIPQTAAARTAVTRPRMKTSGAPGAWPARMVGEHPSEAIYDGRRRAFTGGFRRTGEAPLW